MADDDYTAGLAAHFAFCSHDFETSDVERCAHTPKYKSASRKGNRPTKRTTFTPEQVNLLETEFSKNEYICKDRRSELAKVIDLSECQVKTWFQNRRTKKRRCQTPIRQEIVENLKKHEKSSSHPIETSSADYRMLMQMQSWPNSKSPSSYYKSFPFFPYKKSD